MASPRHTSTCHKSRESQTSQRSPRWTAGGSAALAALALVACHATTPTAAPTTQPVTATPSQGQALRVIVKFRQSVAYSDPSFLGSLSRQVDAQISYIASIAPDTHSYLVVPHAGQGGAAILSRLSVQPSIAWAEEDRKATPAR